MKKLHIILLSLTVSACSTTTPHLTQLSKNVETAIGQVNHTITTQYNKLMESEKILENNKKVTEQKDLQEAENLRKAGKLYEALEAYNKLVAKYRGTENYIDVLEGKGITLVELDKTSEALSLFNEIISIDASRYKTINSIGIILALNGKYKESYEYFDLAEITSNENPVVINNYALARSMAGEHNKALMMLLDARKKLQPENKNLARIDLNIALLYGIMHDMENAKKFAKPHLSEAQLYNNLAVYANLANDAKLAESMMQQSLEKAAMAN